MQPSWERGPLAIPNADFTLRIQPVIVELAPKQHIKTTGYNGGSPGPLIRVREGKTISIDVFNDTGTPEVVHWHGLHVPSEVDGSLEEGTPPVPAHGSKRYTFTAMPSGTRWYHTHIMASRNLNRATYTGQFGFFYIEPRKEPGTTIWKPSSPCVNGTLSGPHKWATEIHSMWDTSVFPSMTAPSAMASRSA